MRLNKFGIRSLLVFAAQSDGSGGGDSGAGDDHNNDDAGNDGAADDKQQQQSRSSRMGGLMQHRQAADESGGEDDGKDDQSSEKKPGVRPKGLPDKFWDEKTSQPKYDDMVKAYSELERQHGELRRQKAGGDLPKAADEYFSEAISIPEAATNFSGLTSEDPGVKAWAATCLENGIGKAMATKLMSGMLEHMNDFVDAPIDYDAEISALGRGGPQLIDGLATWVEGHEVNGSFSDDDLDVVEDLLKSAKGVRFLAKYRQMTGEKPIPVDLSGAGQSAMSREQWQDEMIDAVKTKNYKRQAELEAIGEGINRDRHY